MLVLSRRPSQRIVLSNGVTITVVESQNGKVRLGFDAPADVRIWREELLGRERERTVNELDSMAEQVGNPLPALEMDPDIPLV